jgi:hypothetical protein
MIISKRGLLLASAGLTVDLGLRPRRAQTTKLRFGGGPLLPSERHDQGLHADLRLFGELSVEYSLISTTDWAGMGSGQLDLA